MSLATQLQPAQSEDLIFQRLVGKGFPDQFSRLATAQSGHETAGWTSNVYRTDNNAFGYGYTGSAYQDYDSVESSVDDFADYVKRKVDQGKFPALTEIKTATDWADLLHNAGYYTDLEANYASGIARYFNANLKAIAISAGLLIFGSLLLYFLLRKS